MHDLSKIVKAYDIRGVVPDELDVEVAEALGRAAAVELEAEAVVVGRDMRSSGVELAEGFMAGVRAQGVDSVDIGLASADLLYYASGRLQLPGAMWTASHNPARYNGLKLCRAGAEPISLDTGLKQIRDRAQAGDFPVTDDTGTKGEQDLLGEYAEHVRGFVDVDRMGPVKVAVDAGNGMGGLVVPAVFDGLPAELVPLYFELDGTFPNHPPNPIELDNLRDLQAAVREHGCDVGLAFDGDADRMFCVDERGEPVSPSLVSAVIAETLLRREPDATILYNLICSKVVPETIERAGGHAVRTRVGHSFIKARMKDTGALFAAEHSGHYYFRDNYRADSGLVAAVVLLEALSDSGGALSELVAPYDRYAASGEINSEVDDQQAVTEEVAEAFADEGDADWTDGLTVSGDGWWFNLRPSNTEPVLRLNVEADDPDAMARVRDRVLELVRS
ncbi:MAG TPA: phosphomannomutase/phosphoglucomutase [Egibacteraceae bacterium]|nr:phosphomannomutase/phosphoglucomutase [Actinomycetota bacterium]HWB72038.1 phosphomannomutase/phosphoglucomutase [Egibacteraceae bacterium]